MASGFGFRVSDLGLGVWGLGFGAPDVGVRVEGFGLVFGVQRSGFRVWG